VLAAEHLLDLTTFDEPRELLDPTAELGRDVFALRCPVEEDTEVVNL
jgi:hypothetical protein